MDEEIFALDLVEEFAFAATKFTYSPEGPVVCYDCEAILERLIDVDGMSYDDAIDHIEVSLLGSKAVLLHDIDFEVEFELTPGPHLRLVH